MKMYLVRCVNLISGQFMEQVVSGAMLKRLHEKENIQIFDYQFERQY